MANIIELKNKKTGVKQYPITKSQAVYGPDGSAVSQKLVTDEADIASLKEQISGFTRLSEGSTTGDAELINTRTTWYGTTEASAGNAVRNQAENLILTQSGKPTGNALKGNKVWIKPSQDDIEIPDMDDFNEVRNEINTINRAETLTEWVNGKYISALDDTIDPTSPTTSGAWRYMLLPCTAGKSYTIAGIGGNAPRLWAFCDASYNILLRAIANLDTNGVIITAPQNAKYILINDNKSGRLSYEGISLGADIDSISAEQNAIKTNNDLIITDLYGNFSPVFSTSYMISSSGSWISNSNYPSVYGTRIAIPILKTDYIINMSMGYSYKIFQYSDDDFTFVSATDYIPGTTATRIKDILNPATTHIRINIQNDVITDGSAYNATVAAFKMTNFNSQKYADKETFNVLWDSQISSFEQYDWSLLATETNPSGWRRGYYATASGEYTNSGHYICTNSLIEIVEDNITIHITCPNNYYILAAEYDNSENYLRRIGTTDVTGESLIFNAVKGNKYGFWVGRWENTPDYSETFVSQFKMTQLILNDIRNEKYNKTGTYEFFTVKVDRPLSFGGEEINSEEQDIECVLRLPDTYTKDGTPTRLVLACHGASGYIKKDTSTWYNSNWKALIDSLLAAGYACFDANIFPTSVGIESMGAAYGSPLYVNVLKKAYDYIQEKYNVYPQIFAHGTSMGGVGASAFVNAYPYLVLAQSSFAGRDITQYIYQLVNNRLDDPEIFAKAFGYASLNALNDDKFSHIVGLSPSLSLIKYNTGMINYPPVRDNDYQAWLNYYAEIQSHIKEDEIGDYSATRIVPYKSWNSWADNIQRTKAEQILQKAYAVGSSSPYLCVIYDQGNHTEMSYGQINDMRNQLIAWYKRWE